MTKKIFGNFLPTCQNIASKMRYKKNSKKYFNPKILCWNSSSYQYFNFKNEFFGSKNDKIVVFIVQIVKVKSYCQKLNVRKEQMVVLTSKNLPSAQKFKMLYLSHR